MTTPGGGTRIWLAVATLALVAAPAPGQTTHLDPADGAWEFTGDTEAGVVDGSPVLLMRTGKALRRDLIFDDGVIEFEYRGTDNRAFLGATFRVAGDGTGEDIYFRLHKSKQPDAVQYTPDLRGRGQWQLWHGPGATAFATFRPGEWTPVRIDVSGGRARVTVGSAGAPQLVVASLASGQDSGFIGFWANQPGAGSDAPITAAIRNIRIIHGVAAPIQVDESPPPEPGVVRAWGVSRAVVRDGDDVSVLPSDVSAGTWSAVSARPDGLLPLESHVERPDASGVPAVITALRIESDRARVVRFDLGFSDDASVFLNGQLLYSGRHSFSANFPRRQGLITLDQAALYLPLTSGENALMVVVSDAFGGWGVLGQIADRTGLRIAPGTEPWGGSRDAADSGAGLSDEERAAVAAADRAYADAWLANDADSIMATLSRDVVIFPSGMEAIEGREAIRAFWFPPDSPATTVSKYDLDQAEVDGSADLAYVRGSFTLAFDYDGESYESEGTYLSLLRREGNGDWRIARRTWNDHRRD
jgi:uncharacterized protein (TIGR02246 family)